ncbi:outer membrane protein assembly factor BamC [Parasulfuritortus cantonensis]|uniref:Outer membrane protein assembly factor BamC n=1 Tax=Parasulfuritortus cantonensis TaxID=2528202 RepID=A0A4R1B9A9_9PROT|nr:outer membrane protein assembly factor BamC [Parasulfuritortus cantonensis]TCJ13463.1 outer membrane protein assembly factor BamC [Parasulfuritortus cantonensis]
MRSIATLTVLALALSGCSLMESKKIDYKSAGTLPPLEAPPDLVVPSADNRYSLPNTTSSGSATYSDYNQARGAQAAAAGSTILPQVDKVHMERAGSERWLVVDVPPKEVWPVVKDFWQGLGFIVNVEMPEAGVMETDWAENRAKIPQDALRNMLGKVLDSVYSTAERDKFRTRLEASADGKGTEIYISHKGMYEVYEGTQTGGDEGKGRTVWQPRPADPELEAEMLRRLMVRFGVEESRAQSMLAAKTAAQATVAKAADGAPGLALPEPFDRAWRRVGLALDRIGFTVEDRDRNAGVYFVRYTDLDAQTAKEKEGFFSKLAFWRDDKKASGEKYRVTVSGKDDNSQVAIYRENGQPATDETGNRIVRLLLEQLK